MINEEFFIALSPIDNEPIKFKMHMNEELKVGGWFILPPDANFEEEVEIWESRQNFYESFT
jgi:hypothetical protein